MTLEEDILQAIQNEFLVHPVLLDVDAKIIASAAAKIARERIKGAVMNYNTRIQADISQFVPALRDHGAHCVFCDKINELRNEYLKENGLP